MHKPQKKSQNRLGRRTRKLHEFQKMIVLETFVLELTGTDPSAQNLVAESPK